MDVQMICEKKNRNGRR